MAVFDSPTKTRITGAAARIDPSSRSFIRATAVIGIASFAAAFAVSGSSLYWAGEQIHLPVPLVLPLAIDLPLVAFSLAALARRAKGQSTRSSMAWLLAFSGASVGINAWHSSSLGTAGLDLIGALFIAVVIPLAILSTSEQLLSVLVAPPAHDAERLQREARAADRAATAPAGVTPTRPKRGTAEYSDRVADAKALRADGASKASLGRGGFSMSEINEAGA